MDSNVIHLHIPGHGGIRGNKYLSCPNYDPEQPDTWYKMHIFKNHNNEVVYEGEKNRLMVEGIKAIADWESDIHMETMFMEPEDLNLENRVELINQFCEEHSDKTVLLHEHHANAFDGYKRPDFNGTANGYECYTVDYKNSRSPVIGRTWINKMTEQFGDENSRGLKYKNYYIIRNVSCYACLYEWYFFDNWQDYQLFSSEDGFKNMVTAMIKTMKELNKVFADG